MDGNAGGELGTALIRTASSCASSVDDRYDAIGSTAATRISSRTLVGSIIDGTPPKVFPVTKDEADVAAGATLSPQVDSSLTGFALAVIIFFSTAGESLLKFHIITTNNHEKLISSTLMMPFSRRTIWSRAIHKGSWKSVCNYWCCCNAFFVGVAGSTNDI